LVLSAYPEERAPITREIFRRSWRSFQAADGCSVPVIGSANHPLGRLVWGAPCFAVAGAAWVCGWAGFWLGLSRARLLPLLWLVLATAMTRFQQPTRRGLCLENFGLLLYEGGETLLLQVSSAVICGTLVPPGCVGGCRVRSGAFGFGLGTFWGGTAGVVSGLVELLRFYVGVLGISACVCNCV
jgi:hypothetical protein